MASVFPSYMLLFPLYDCFYCIFVDAMKVKRKKSYMKQWQKQVVKSDDALNDMNTGSLNSR